MKSEPHQYNSCAILIVSCDSYRDLWGPCITLLQRFWIDCPYKVYLLSNQIAADFKGITPITTGKDISWSDNVLYALDQIPETYVFLYIEDLLLKSPAKSSTITTLIQRLMDEGGNYLRLNPTPAADKPLDDTIGTISQGTVYRSSVVMSVWKKSTLKDLLIPGENAWEFEEKGTERTDKYSQFYASTTELMPVCNTIIKGVWETNAFHTITSLGISPDLSSRRVMNGKEQLLWKLKTLRSTIFHLLPSGMRRSVKALLKN